MQFSAGAGIARKSARASATACTLAHTSPAIEAARGLSSSESAQPNRPRAGDCSTLLWPLPILRAIFDTRYTPLLGRGVASSWLFSFAGAPVRSYFGCLHFICRTGKSRVLRILSPDDLVMENGSQYAETNVPGFSSVFSTQMLAEAGGAGIAPVRTALGQRQETFHAGRQKTGGDSQRISSRLTSSRILGIAISTR